MLEGLGRLLDLPMDHPTGWGWDARLFVNSLHDRTAACSAQHMVVSPGDSVLMVGAGAIGATLRLARRLHRDLHSCGHGTLCVSDPSTLQLRETKRALSILHDAAAPIDVTLVAAAPNMQPPTHPR